MNMEDIKKSLSLYYKRLKKDIAEKTITIKKYNDYAYDIEHIKDLLYSKGESYEWVDDLDELETFNGGIFDYGPPKSELLKNSREALEQAERILTKLGVDVDNLITITNSKQIVSSQANPNININVSPTLMQTANVSTELHIDIRLYIKEFEQEISKPKPDKAKLKSLLEIIKDKGKEYLPTVIDIILKHWDKFKFGTDNLVFGKLF